MPLMRSSTARRLPPFPPGFRGVQGVTHITITVAPEYTGDNALEAASIASATTVGAASLAVSPRDLTAASITVTPTVGGTSLTAAASLTAASITAAPTVGATSLAVSSRDLVAASVTSSPTVGTASLTVGALDLTAATITAAPTVGAATLSQAGTTAQDLQAAGITNTGTIGTPAITQPFPQSLTAGSITLTTVVAAPYLEPHKARTVAALTTSTGSASLSDGRHSAAATGDQASAGQATDRAVAQLVD